MRKFVALLAVVLFVSSTSIALAKVDTGSPLTRSATQASMSSGLGNDISAPVQGGAKTDTVSFGYYTVGALGVKYAVLNGMWTFDHGADDPFEGWTSRDKTANDHAYWRQLTEARWLAEGGVIGWPAMTGNGMILCGATEGAADSLGWLGGRGYGNNWCQMLKSPPLTYDGTGTEDLSLNYFSEAELDYDYTKIIIKSSLGSENAINTPGFTGKLGIDTATGVLSPLPYTKTISNSDFGGGTTQRTINIVIEFKADGGLSDEDLADATADSYYGAIGMDNISLTGLNLVPPGPVTYGFETDLQGWTASVCLGIGAYMGVANRSNYTLADPCACALSENVLEFHDDTEGLLHPNTQDEEASSPICDRTQIPGDYLVYNRIIAEWNQYTDLPRTNGVFYRPGWKYYPYENPQVPGLIAWSNRVGQNTWYYAGDIPACTGPTPPNYEGRNIGTDWGLPTNAQQVKFVYEVSADCVAFGVDPCSGVTNFTPIIDNIRIRNVGFVNAPVCQYRPGTRFQDGFGQGAVGSGGLSSADPGNSDIAYDLRRGDPPRPTKLGDSLMVEGPTPSSAATKWEAKLWFRLKRVGPGQTSAMNPGAANYNLWKNAVGPNVNYPNFAWGYMDSVELPTVMKNQFCSYFREGSPGYNWGGGTTDRDPRNKMLPDLVFTPGTKIEYFVTTNYIPTPTAYYYYPDTTGRVFSEFEILPSYRTVGAVEKFPCVLWVNAGGGAYYTQRALNVVLNGALPGARVPDPTTWDRYDYTDASSNWNGPFYRTALGTSGATIPQLMGYKLIMVGAGDLATGGMEPRDWAGFQQWLQAIACTGDANLQGLIVDGKQAAQIIEQDYPSLLTTMGAIKACDTYNQVGCPVGDGANNDQNNCVRIVEAAGTPFGPGIATDVFGNWCPEQETFNVLGVGLGGVGNKKYRKVLSGDPGYLTSFAQVIRDQKGVGSNYRTVIEGFSWHRLTDVRNITEGLGECVFATLPADTLARVTAAYKEIENAIKWTMAVGAGGGYALGDFCVDPCNILDPNSGVPDAEGAGALVTRLYQNHPNPFNPRTAIKFSLAADGPTKLIIYDVNGRSIRTLVDKGLKAGQHEEIWDGTDDAGHTVTSGVYWSQLQAGTYSSNKKMVVLK